MNEFHPYPEGLRKMFGQVLGGVDRAVLSACTSKRNRKMAETSLEVSFDRSVYQGIDVFQERKDFTILFNETDDRFIQPAEFLVWLVSSWVMDGTAVKDKTSAISTWVGRNTFLV